MDPFDLRLWSNFVTAGGNLNDPAIINQIAIDSRRIDSLNSLFVALPGANFDGHQFIPEIKARYALVKKDWPLLNPPSNVILLRVDDPLAALQEIAGTYRKQLPTKFIAISGSYGKTMVKDLLETILSTSKKVAASPESFNSQIGVALSLFTVNQNHEIALIEAAVSQKNEMEKLVEMIAPDFSIITHIGKKHAATLGGLESVADEILKLPRSVCHEGWSLLPSNPYSQSNLPKIPSKKYFWDTSPNLPQAKTIQDYNGTSMPYQIDFPDGTQYQNQTNFGFAYFLDLLNITIKAAWLLGITSDSIRSALTTYTAEPTRTEIWRSIQGTTFINDTYCSDPQSISRSLKHFSFLSPNSNKIFLFGGMRSNNQQILSDYRHIGETIGQAKLDQLFLIGIYPFNPLVTEVVARSPETSITFCKSYQEAYDLLRPKITPDDTVLIKGSKKEPLNVIEEAFNDSTCNNQCLINLAAIENNLTAIRKKIGVGTRVMVIVKALAYGTNDVRVSQFLSTCGIDIFGVSFLDEGIALKRAGVKQSIFVINAAIHEAVKAVKWDLEVGVSEYDMITALGIEAAKKNKKVKVHLHIDTGMNRFGCRSENALKLARHIKTFPSLILEGIMTHFAAADDPSEDAFTISQANCFESIVNQLKDHGITAPWIHACNSSGSLRFNFPQFNMVRIGLAIYGLYPSQETGQILDLRLAISLISRIVGINVCKVGETISYGRSYECKRDLQRIAVLSIGYFDGLHRNYSGKSTVNIRGHQAPIVGKICMDFMMVDITDIPEAKIGDSVLIFGEDEFGYYQSPEDLAANGNTIAYELITCLGPRIQRIFIYEEALQIR